MKIFFINLKKVLSSKLSLFSLFIGISIIAIPSYYFTDRVVVIGNLGYAFYYTEVVLGVIISILFGLFIASTVYKIKYFSTHKSFLGIVGGFLGIAVSGCPSCSITLASYIGLAGFMSIFPFYGIELKFISVFMLLYANISTIKNLEICKLKK